MRRSLGLFRLGLLPPAAPPDDYVPPPLAYPYETGLLVEARLRTYNARELFELVVRDGTQEDWDRTYKLMMPENGTSAFFNVALKHPKSGERWLLVQTAAAVWGATQTVRPGQHVEQPIRELSLMFLSLSLSATLSREILLGSAIGCNPAEMLPGRGEVR